MKRKLVSILLAAALILPASLAAAPEVYADDVSYQKTSISGNRVNYVTVDMSSGIRPDMRSPTTP